MLDFWGQSFAETGDGYGVLARHPKAGPPRPLSILRSVPGANAEEPTVSMSRTFEFAASTDAELVAACGRGDSRAWRALVHRYRRLVYGVARVLGLQPADADEVFQLTFVALLRALPRLRDPQRLDAWLVTATRRATFRLKRDERRRQRLAEQGAAEFAGARTVPSTDAEIERLREGERVLHALESLGDPCHTLLSALFGSKGESYRSVATRLGLAVGSLGATRKRCLQRLRLRLVRERRILSPMSASRLNQGGRQ